MRFMVLFFLCGVRANYRVHESSDRIRRVKGDLSTKFRRPSRATEAFARVLVRGANGRASSLLPTRFAYSCLTAWRLATLCSRTPAPKNKLLAPADGIAASTDLSPHMDGTARYQQCCTYWLRAHAACHSHSSRGTPLQEPGGPTGHGGSGASGGSAQTERAQRPLASCASEGTL